MEVTTKEQGSLRRPFGRIVSTALVAGTVSASLFAVGTASALSSHTSTSAKVSTAKTTKLGTFLVSGKTLYTLSKNDCNTACLKIWPALLLPKGVTNPTAGSGVSGAKLGTVKIASGLQVTYGGKPLYWFAKDSGPGKVTGNKVKDKWGVWSIVVTAKPKAGGGGGSTTTAPAGGGTGF
jgi:predicted lipoprotein with Yx(FWY)xxD motif